MFLLHAGSDILARRKISGGARGLGDDVRLRKISWREPTLVFWQVFLLGVNLPEVGGGRLRPHIGPTVLAYQDTVCISCRLGPSFLGVRVRIARQGYAGGYTLQP